MKPLLPLMPVTKTGLLPSQELLEILQIAQREDRAMQERIGDIEATISGNGFGYTAFFVDENGNLIVSYVGIAPAFSIADGDLILTHTNAPPPFSIDATGSVILEV